MFSAFSAFSRRAFSFTRDAVWSKVLLFCFILFLIRLADGIISFWAPVQIQNILGSATVMGLIISFQSVVGFAVDLVFPKMLRRSSARNLVFAGIIMSGATSFFLVNTVFWPFAAIFLVTMALWGIYYELIAFANYQFMGSTVPVHLRASGWAMASIFVNLAYFLGPLMATNLLAKGYVITEAVIIIFLVAALVLLFSTEKIREAVPEVDLHDINPWVELKHWLTLSKHIWPAIIITLLLGAIDSTFWTIGAVLTEKLSGQSFWGGLFLPAYQFPAIVMGLIIARWGIYRGKKILSEKMLILAGVFLVALVISKAIAWQLIMVFLSSVALSVSYPLIEGVISDIIARMGKEKKEMIGLTSSTINVAYVIWPPIAGFIASRVGEIRTFSVVGGMTALVALVLLFITPKKLRLPQEEIRTWE